VKNPKLVSWLSAVCASLAFTFSAIAAHAQAPASYGPTDPISFTITFGGEGAPQIANIDVRMLMTTALSPDQPGFSMQIDATNVKQIAPGRFQVSGTVPDYVGSGTFTLQGVYAGPPGVGDVYEYRTDLPKITITVVNPKHFAKPDLKGVEINPKS
jgi:hypothetical protein